MIVALACGGDKKVTELPPLQPFQGAQAERLHQIRAKAVEVRGLLHLEFAEEGTLSREALKEFLRQAAAREREEAQAELEATNIAWRLLHLIGPEDDLVELSTESTGEAILGFYVSEEDRLVLIASEDDVSPANELTLAHEYVHSFQDKRFDLERLDKLAQQEKGGDVSTEYGATVDCIIEGDATFSEYKYAEEVLGPDWQDLVTEEPTEFDADAYPEALGIYGGFPYSTCAYFVADVYYAGGWLAVNDLYKDPPKTTEQVLHPEKYFAKDGARPLSFKDMSSRLGEGWQQMLSDAWGELDVIAYLVANLGDYERAYQAAAGWGGGRIALYRRDGDGAAQQVLVHLAVNWDSDADFQEFLAAERDVIAKVSGGRVQPEGDNILRWQGDREHGYVRWDAGQRRMDVLIAVDELDLQAAVAALDGDHSA